MKNLFLACPICSQVMDFVGEADYLYEGLTCKNYIFYCTYCEIYYRDVSPNNTLKHCSESTYGKLENEPDIFSSREVFLEDLIILIKSFFKTRKSAKINPIKLVDFGTGYGHLLKIAREHGFNAIGIEANQQLIDFCNQQGLSVLKQLDEIIESVDVLTMIDSLYYLNNPKQTLTKMREILKPNGLVLVRVTSRNIYVWLARHIFNNKNYLDFIGDAVVSYSPKGLINLFNQNGFKIIKFIPDGGFNKKKMGLKKRMLYTFTYFLTKLTGNKLILTPGFIAIAKAEI